MESLVKKISILSIGLLTPHSLAFAAPRNFTELVNMFTGIINSATVVLFSAAIAFFFWKVAQGLFGYDGDNATKKQELRDTLVWGIVIIFVMVSIWGIIAILQSTLKNGL